MFTFFEQIFQLSQNQSSLFINPFILGFGLLLIGLFGLIFTRSNVIILIMNLELMLLGCGLNFLMLNNLSSNIFSYSFALFILAFAAAEAAIGLGLIVNLFTVNKSLNLSSMVKLHG